MSPYCKCSKLIKPSDLLMELRVLTTNFNPHYKMKATLSNYFRKARK